jgi:uncharacterized protein (DUF58 family)
MLAALRSRLRERVSDWIFRARVPEEAPVILVQRRIFIVPTKQGYLFAGIMMLLLLASMNYQLSLGYLLAFLLVSIASVGMLHTWRNLSRLAISPGRADPVFAGETARFKLVLKNSGMPRYSVAAVRRDGEPQYLDVGPEQSGQVELPVAAEKRGLLHCGRVEIFTHYPLGLFHAWAYVDFGMTCVVYPKPDPAAGALPVDADSAGEGSTLIPGNDEFNTLRAYRPGDSPRLIAWKALAREQGLLSKEFASTASSELWLSWDHFAGFGNEERLSRLAYWVLEADRLGLVYGLTLPSKKLPLSWGDAHRLACLEALALFEVHA